MLKSLHIQHFTVFQDARFDFSPGLNIVIGDNGTGKTHLLKLAYLFCRAWHDLTGKRLRINRQRAEAYLDERLANLFRVSDLGVLVRQGHKNGASLEAVVGGHIPTLQIRMPSDPPFLSPGLDGQMPWHIKIKRPKNESAKVEAVTVPDAAATNTRTQLRREMRAVDPHTLCVVGAMDAPALPWTTSAIPPGERDA